MLYVENGCLFRRNMSGPPMPLKERLDAMETHLDGYGIVPLHGSGTTNTKNWQLGDEGLCICIYCILYTI